MKSKELQMQLWIVRHAEAEKTLADIHGGPGTPLTHAGRVDALELSGWLHDQLGDGFTVWCSRRRQIYDTALLICSVAHATLRVSAQLESIQLGVLDGLSDSDAWLQYPEVQSKLDDWRHGHVPATEVQIPGAESLSKFRSRIGRIQRAISRDFGQCVIVVSRSVGIALINGVLDAPDEEYRRYKLDPASVTILDVEDGGLVRVNYTDYLTRGVARHDS